LPRVLSYGYQSHVDGQLVEIISRRDFLAEFGHDYQPGQHVTFIGPTGRGKSTLAFQCLQQVVSPEMQVITLHGKIKGRDPVVGRASKQLNLRVVPELPGETRIRYDQKRKYNGYMLVPLERPEPDPVKEKELLTASFKPAMQRNYTNMKQKTITHYNESAQVQHELKLQELCEATLQRGGPDNAGWHEIQRGRWVSYHCFSAPEHMFVFYDDDRDTRRRYADFGTADPRAIEELCANLRTDRSRDGRTISQCLYMRRGGGMFVVDT